MIRAGMMMHYVTIGTREQGSIRAKGNARARFTNTYSTWNLHVALR